MINVKDQVYSAIKGICEQVTDLYPGNWAQLPAIQYTEEENRVQEWTDGEEQKAYLRYRIDVWNSGSTSAATLAVDQAISALGLMRTSCSDVPDPSGLRHKQIRYEGVIDVHTEQVYNNDIY